jgi:hypothetical protein
MKTVIHRAETRGKVSFGWLEARHSFSFGHYFNPERIHFGALRVLNDDIIQGGTGFGTHPHANMEIVTIPLSGALEHKDSTGNSGVLYEGDVQIMSAGYGVEHSEFNHHKDTELRLFQIWVLPKEMDIEPRYDQATFTKESRLDKWLTIVSPVKGEALWLNQETWFKLADFSRETNTSLKKESDSSGIYLMVIEGEAKIGNDILGKRDAGGYYDFSGNLEITVTEGTRLLSIEVPMLG